VTPAMLLAAVETIAATVKTILSGCRREEPIDSAQLQAETRPGAVSVRNADADEALTELLTAAKLCS
jgi:hypothetical protein